MAKKAAEKPGSFVYVGPTVSRTRLVECAVFQGTREKIESFLISELTVHPEAARLIVPLEELAEARVKVKSTGNALGRTYAKLAGAK